MAKVGPRCRFLVFLGSGLSMPALSSSWKDTLLLLSSFSILLLLYIYRYFFFSQPDNPSPSATPVSFLQNLKGLALRKGFGLSVGLAGRLSYETKEALSDSKDLSRSLHLDSVNTLNPNSDGGLFISRKCNLSLPPLVQYPEYSVALPTKDGLVLQYGFFIL